MTERHIVGMGGGGFHMEPENPLLDDFVLSLARRSPARICLVPTASGDNRELIIRFYRAFSGRAIATDLTLVGSPQLATHPPRSSQLESFVLEQDIIYVSGGTAVNMLALWRAHGLDKVLRTAWEQGVVMAGMSAGLICWFEEFIDSSMTGKPTRMRDGLGLLKGSASPHYDVAPARRAGYRSLVEQAWPKAMASTRAPHCTSKAPSWSRPFARVPMRRRIASRAAPMAKSAKKSCRPASSARTEATQETTRRWPGFAAAAVGGG